jgi:hypothetical protein
MQNQTTHSDCTEYYNGKLWWLMSSMIHVTKSLKSYITEEQKILAELDDYRQSKHHALKLQTKQDKYVKIISDMQQNRNFTINKVVKKHETDIPGEHKTLPTVLDKIDEIESRLSKHITECPSKMDETLDKGQRLYIRDEIYTLYRRDGLYTLDTGDKSYTLNTGDKIHKLSFSSAPSFQDHKTCVIRGYEKAQAETLELLTVCGNRFTDMTKEYQNME